MLAKSLTFLAGADAAGIVLGAKVPIILTSRADSVMTRLASCAVASLVVAARREARQGRAVKPAEALAMVDDAIAVLNAGSSSIKFSLFLLHAARQLEAACAARSEGLYTRRASSPRTRRRRAATRRTGARACSSGHDGALDHLIRFVREHLGDAPPGGHRPPGGARRHAVRQAGAHRREVLQALREFVPLAPLHQPHNLAPIRAAARAAAGAAAGGLLRHRVPPQQPPRSRRCSRCRRSSPTRACAATASTACPTSTSPRCCRGGSTRAAPGRTVVLHLGNGASMCAIAGGRSVASTMGFTAVDGLPMGTRCGASIPGVILYLMDERGMDARAIEKLVYSQSGLLGVSGISSDMRTLLASDDAQARSRDRPVRLPHRARAGLAGRRAGRARRDRLHRRHRRERRADPRARLRGRGWLGVELDAAANAATGRASAPPQPRPPG